MSTAEQQWPVYIFILLGLIGLFDTTYLTASHFRDTAVVCSLFEGCDVVLQSRYAVISGIPLALVGVLYYFMISFGAMVGRITGRGQILRGVSYLTTLGFFVSLILVYLQIWVIGSLCQFCIISAIVSTLLFITAILYLRGKKGGNMTSSLYESETVQ